MTFRQRSTITKIVICHSKHSLLQEQWPEGAKAVTEVTKRPKSAGTTFKESMISLVENLKNKDPFYIRCIKPNETKSALRFDDKRCLHQVSMHGLFIPGIGVFSF